MTFQTTIAIRPKPKGRPRFGRGRTWTPKATADYETAIAVAVREVCKEAMAGPLALKLEFVFHRTSAAPRGVGRAPRDVTPDLDNLTKAVMDGLNKAEVWDDDRQVVSIEAVKLWGAKGEPDSVTVSLGRYQGVRSE